MQAKTIQPIKKMFFGSLLFFAGELEVKSQSYYLGEKLKDTSITQVDSSWWMNDEMLELDEVVITTPQLHYLPEKSGTQIYAGKKTELIQLKNLNANLATNTSRQVYAKVPGITVWENDASGVQVNISARGLSPNRSWEFNMRQNGYDIVPDIYGYPEAYFTPPPQAVEQIQVIRGAASLQYGQQFGGVVNYILKKAPKDKKFQYETQNSTGTKGLFNSFHGVGGTIKKFSYHAHYEYRRGDGTRNNNIFQIHNAHAHFGYAISKKVQLGAELTHFNYKNQQPGGLTDSMFNANPKQSVRGRNWFGTPWWVWQVNLHAKPSDKVVLDWKIYGLRGQRNSVGVYWPVTIPDTINANTLEYNNRQVDRDSYLNFGTEFRSLTNYKLFKQSHALSAGFRLYHAYTNRQQLGVGTRGEDFDLTLVNDSFPRDLIYKTNSAAFFMENIFHITENFSVIPGLRYEYIHVSTDGRVNIINGVPLAYDIATQTRSVILAGVALDYKLAHSTNLYYNIAQAYRPIYFVELTPIAMNITIDPKLEDARGFNMDFGYRGTVKDFFSFDMGGYYMLYKNRVGTITKYVNNDPAQGSYFYRTNLGASRSAGVEAFIEFDAVKAFTEKRKFGTLSVFASIGYTNAKYKNYQIDTLQAGNLVSYNLKGNFVEYAPQHNHRFGLTYTLKGFSTTFQVAYTGDFYTDPLNTEIPHAQGHIGKVDAYTVVDWAFTYRFLEKYNVKFGINNLTNKKYATRRALGYPGPGLLPAEVINWFVSAGIKI